MELQTELKKQLKFAIPLLIVFSIVYIGIGIYGYWGAEDAATTNNASALRLLVQAPYFLTIGWFATIKSLQRRLSKSYK